MREWVEFAEPNERRRIDELNGIICIRRAALRNLIAERGEIENRVRNRVNYWKRKRRIR